MRRIRIGRAPGSGVIIINLIINLIIMMLLCGCSVTISSTSSSGFIVPAISTVNIRRPLLLPSFSAVSSSSLVEARRHVDLTLSSHKDHDDDTTASGTRQVQMEAKQDKIISADTVNSKAGMSRTGFLARGLLAVGLGASTSTSLLNGLVGGRRFMAAHAAPTISDVDLPPVAFKTKSGLRYYDVRQGEGPSPKWGQVAIIHYEGYVRPSPFSKTVLFDDTYVRKTPFIIKHGNGRVIRGLDEGLHTMKLGGLRRIVIPLKLGYTKTGLGPIPPNALRRKVLVRELSKAEQNEGEIIYDVELLSVYDDEADLGYYSDLTFDGTYLQEGLAKSLQELRDKGVKVPSTKSFQTKPQILGSQRADGVGLPENLL